MESTIQCWCGNKALATFSTEYLLCQQCQTLVSQVGLAPEKTIVKNDEEDFYGKNYWFNHQNNDLGYPDIVKRSRADLSERGLHWLRTVLKYKFAPAKVLELGCAHGGFVALLRQTGYNAMGLEMSPAIAQFARETFNISTLTGPIEQQTIEPGSLDILVMMDVLEHLPTPVDTLRHCITLLKPDGILILQTPGYKPGVTHADMLAKQSPFLEQLKSDEHLFLFSPEGIPQFFKQISNEPFFIEFHPAIFSQYDMYFVASRAPLITHTEEQINQFLTQSVNTRIIQALLDAGSARDNYVNLYQQADMDRQARLKIIEDLRSKQASKRAV